MTVRPTPTIRPGYLYEADDGPKVAVYCEPCTSFYVKGFGDGQTPQAFREGQSFRRMTNCPFSRGNPSRCLEHEITYAGEAPPSMVAWLEADKPDWPKCPEDFIDGGRDV